MAGYFRIKCTASSRFLTFARQIIEPRAHCALKLPQGQGCTNSDSEVACV